MENIDGNPEPYNPITVHPILPKKSFKEKIAGFFANFRTKRKVIAGSVGTLALIAFLSAGIFLVQQRQSIKTKATGLVLSLSSNNTHPNVGDTFVVAIAMDPQGMQATGVDLKINYDSNLLQVVDGKPGTLLPLVFSSIGVSGNTITAAFGANPSNITSTSGVLGQITFKAKANGVTSITFNPATMASALGQTTNIVGAMNPVQITIGSGGSPSTPPPPSAPGINTPGVSSAQLVKSYNPWAVSLSGTNIAAGLKVKLFYPDGTQRWGGDNISVLAVGDQLGFQLPGNTPPWCTSPSAVCIVKIQLATVSGVNSNIYDLTVDVPSSTPLVISSATIFKQLNPWAVGLAGTGITTGMKVKLYYPGSTLWTENITTDTLNGVTGFQLPSNNPTGCGGSCQVGVQVVNSAGKASNIFTFTLQ